MLKRSRALECYRFLAAVMILGYHCQWVSFLDKHEAFYGCYIFVELFYILSGFLLMDGVRRETAAGPCPDPAASTWQYMKRRLKKIYPHHILSFVLMLVLRCFLVKDLTLAKAAEAGWAELLLVNIFGFVRGDFVNIVCWYLSGLIFASVLIRYLLLRDAKGFIVVAAPIILVLCYGALFDRVECLAVTILFTQFSAPLGFYRALADMTVGVLGYVLYEKLSDVESPLEPIISTVLEIAILASSVLWMMDHIGKVDFLLVPLFLVFVISVFRGKSLLSRLLDNRVSEWLGDLSFAYFLNNMVAIYIYRFLFPKPKIWQEFFVCVPLCFVISLATRWVTSLGGNKLKPRKV